MTNIIFTLCVRVRDAMRSWEMFWKCSEQKLVVSMHHFVEFTWKAINNLHFDSQAIHFPDNCLLPSSWNSPEAIFYCSFVDWEWKCKNIYSSILIRAADEMLYAFLISIHRVLNTWICFFISRDMRLTAFVRWRRRATFFIFHVGNLWIFHTRLLISRGFIFVSTIEAFLHFNS